MARNTLMDLQNHIFAELERLDDEDLHGDELKSEVRRASAIGELASTAVANANTMLNAVNLKRKLGAYVEPDSVAGLLGAGKGDPQDGTAQDAR